MRFDTYIGMGYSNVISLFIIVATAATFTRTASPTSRPPLRPRRRCGQSPVFSPSRCSQGVIGIGLFACPRARRRCVGCARRGAGWTTGLDCKPLTPRHSTSRSRFRPLSASASLYRPDPIKALFWSAVINGVVAVPLMVIIMLMAMREDVMGDFVLPRALWAIGRLFTATMTVVVAITFATW